MVAIHRRHVFTRVMLSAAVWLIAATATVPAQEISTTAKEANANPERFVSEEGGYSAIFPKKPQRRTDPPSLFLEPGEKILETFDFVELPGISYAVKYADDTSAEGKTPEQVLQLLEAKKTEFLAPIGAVEIKEDKAINISETVRGREYLFFLKGKLEGGRFRTFFANKRFYLVMTLGSPQLFAQPEAKNFLSSFRLLNPLNDDESTLSQPSQPEGVPFTSTEAEFSINFPVKPRHDVENLTDDNGGEFVQDQFVSETDSGTFMVAVQSNDNSLFTSSASRQTVFTTTRDRLRKVFGGEVLEDKDVTIGKSVPGREFRVSIPQDGGEYRTQVFFANQRFYQIVAAGTPEFTRSQQTQAVFDSFKLLEDSDSKTSTSSGSNELSLYESTYGRFGILLDAKPTYQRSSIRLSGGARLTRHQYIAGKSPKAVFILFVDLSEDVLQEAAAGAQFFESTANSFAKEFDGELKLLTRINEPGEADDFTFRVASSKPDQYINGRLLLREGRFYNILVIGTEEFSNSQIAAEILNSFVTDQGE